MNQAAVSDTSGSGMRGGRDCGKKCERTAESQGDCGGRDKSGMEKNNFGRNEAFTTRLGIGISYVFGRWFVNGSLSWIEHFPAHTYQHFRPRFSSVPTLRYLILLPPPSPVKPYASLC